MKNVEEIKRNLAIFRETAFEIEKLLDNSNKEVNDCFNEVYDFEDEFYEFAAKIQNLEIEFAYALNKRISSK